MKIRSECNVAILKIINRHSYILCGHYIITTVQQCFIHFFFRKKVIFKMKKSQD